MAEHVTVLIAATFLDVALLIYGASNRERARSRLMPSAEGWQLETLTHGLMLCTHIILLFRELSHRT